MYFQKNRAQLVIEKLPNDYLMASLKSDDAAQQYITSSQGRPLKFLSVAHIREFLQGERIDQVFMIDDKGHAEEVECW